jgi:hypothetical protein
MRRLALLPFLLLTACIVQHRSPSDPILASDMTAVLSRAQFDLDCNQQEINVARANEPDRTVYIAGGCGRSLPYVITCTRSNHATEPAREQCSARVLEQD